MRSRLLLLTTLLLAGLAHPGAVPAQTTTISDADCARLRQNLAGHAQLSEGVRRAVAARAGTVPAAAAAPAAPAGGRADAIRARLEQITKERQALEEQRLGAMVRFDLTRAGQIQTQLQTLELEKSTLEREAATLPPPTSGGAAASAPPPAADPVTRVRCQDVPAALDEALKTRRRELGVKEDQAGAIPLVALKGQSPDQIGQELASQFAAGAAASTQVGLIDSEGKGRLDGVVDSPVPGVFRLVRQRTDGTLSVDAFPASAGAAPAYGDVTRRIDETSARQSGQALGDVLATRPAGSVRAATQTGDFAGAYAQYQAGNFADAARLGPAARSAEFPNARGQSVRVLELITPVSGGVSVRRAVVIAQPSDQEIWEETTTLVRPVSYWKTEVEVTRKRETRATATGAVVGAPAAPATSKFSIER